MKIVTACAPGNISLLFTVVENKDPLKMGSKGLGFTIDQGVGVSVSKSDKSKIYWNNSLIEIPTVNFVVKKLSRQNLKIAITSSLPLGCGFGLSGASALATAYAINKLLDLKKTNLELAKIAHCAEVINKTGLGDVTNEYFGGFCFKTKVSSAFDVIKLDLVGKKLYYKVFEKLSTKETLSNQDLITTLNQIGEKKLEAIFQLVKNKTYTIEKLFEISYLFCKQAGLLQNNEVIKIITELKNSGKSATMILIGNAVIATQSFFGSSMLTVGNKGAHLIS